MFFRLFMKILFLCKHNRFRSKVGECIFNKININKKINAESAGLIGSIHPTCKNVVDVLKEKGYNLVNFIPRRVDNIKIKDYDILVIVADNVDPIFFKDSYNGKIIWWKVTDCDESDVVGIRERVNEIEEKIKELIKELK